MALSNLPSESVQVGNEHAAEVVILDNSGNVISTFGGGTEYTEDAPAAANPVGGAQILVRADTPGTLVSTDGDNVAQRGTNYGAAYVQVVSSAGSFIDTFGGSGGTAQADESAFTEGTTTFTPSGGVLNDTIVSDPTEDQAAAVRITAKRAFHVNLRNVGGTEVGTAAAPVRTDPTGTTTQPVSGTVTANIGTFPDNEPFNVAQINGVTPLMGNGVTGTGSQRVTIASDNTAFTVNVGTFPDNEPFNVAQINGVTPLMGNGVTGTGSQRVTIASDNTAFTVNVGTFPDNEPFNVAQINGVTPLMGAGNTGTGSPRVTIASDQAVIPVGGNVAHDAVDSGNPVKIGGFAQLNERTAVADADRVDAWFDQIGRQVCLLGHANPEAPVTANGSAAGVSVIAAPGANLSLYICKGSLHNSAAAEAVVSLRDGAAGTIRFTANLAADGGGCLFDFGSRGWKLTANTALVMDAASATQYCNVTEYYIAA